VPSREVLGKFRRGALHSGSKSGPVITSRKQAIAVMLSEKRNEDEHGGSYFGGDDQPTPKRSRPTRRKA
jgi:hypothetical protein